MKKESQGDENPTIEPNGDADDIVEDRPGSRLVSPLSSLFSHKVKAPFHHAIKHSIPRRMAL